MLEAEAKVGRELPLMISMTLTDLSGRNLSGHTVEAFWYAVRHAKPLTIGLNCSFGAAQLRPHVKVLSEIADALVMVYPNAGLPNELGEYDELPRHDGGAGPRMGRAWPGQYPRRLLRLDARAYRGDGEGGRGIARARRSRKCRCGRGWPGWSRSRWRRDLHPLPLQGRGSGALRSRGEPLRLPDAPPSPRPLPCKGRGLKA